jgi:tetratricopeptide (TPR) repeat protein
MTNEDDQVVALLERTFDRMPSALQRAAMLLSVCLAASEDELSVLAQEVWHEESSFTAISDLFGWPFIEERGDGYRVLPALAIPLARRFRQTEPKAFIEAHRIMADRERMQMERARMSEDVDTFLDAWYARGRLAFYLAGVRPDEAADEFGHAFEETLSLSPYETRIWLSTLVLRQRDLLTDYSRVVDFFSGFRAYTAHRITEANESFQRVLAATDARDVYRAIALHLCALTVKAPTVGASLLVESIGLSRELGLIQNEVMARNSLAATYLSMSNRLSRDVQGVNERDIYSDLAYQAADENLNIARNSGDKSLLPYCLAMHATTSWIRARRRGSISEQVYNRAIDELSESISIADQLGQPETALRSLNQRATIHREYGDYNSTIADMKEAVDRLGYDNYLLDIRQRLGKTLGSLIRVVPVKQRKIVYALLDDIQRRLHFALLCVNSQRRCSSLAANAVPHRLVQFYTFRAFSREHSLSRSA